MWLLLHDDRVEAGGRGGHLGEEASTQVEVAQVGCCTPSQHTLLVQQSNMYSIVVEASVGFRQAHGAQMPQRQERTSATHLREHSSQSDTKIQL